MNDRPKVSTINPSLKDLQPPPGTGGVQAWLCWRAEMKPGLTKLSKVPYYSSGDRRRGKQGSREDRDKLVTFEAAKAAAIRKGFTGVGFAVLPSSSVVALDFDNVVENELIFTSIASALSNTYAEYSPSGKGIRAFVMQSEDISKVPRFQNLKSHASAGNDFTFEVFATSGFVTYTGHVLDPKAQPKLADAPSDAILKLYESRLAKRGPVFGMGAGQGTNGASPSSTSPPVGYSIEELHHILKEFNPSASYDDWIEVGMCLHHETGGSQDGFDVWHAWSMTGDSYVSEGDCEYHWLSFRKTEGAKTMRTLMKRISAAGAKVSSPMATADDFDDMTGVDDDEIRDEHAEPDRFQPIQVAEYVKRPPTNWLVKGLIQEGDPVNTFGPSGSGKSFVVFDIVMSIARGIPWRGLRVKQGRVVHICAEGAGGFRTRIDAYREYHQVELEHIPLHVIPAAPSLLKPKDIKDLIAAIEGEVHGAEVIVIDTLAQTTPGGNENSSEDMGAALTAVNTLGNHFSATVILVHHTGKDVNRGARGWSGIKGAMGTQLEVIVGENGSRCLHVEKLKDGEGGANYTFKLVKVNLGVDEEGEEVTSCVVVVDGEVPAGRPDRIYGRKGRVGPAEQRVLAALERLELGDGIISLPVLIDAVVRVEDNADNEPLHRLRSRAQRAIKTLTKKKQIGCLGDVYFSEKD